MDIVKNRIENLSGSVDVRSTPGQGTTFTIRLPLTLAIMSSLLVRIFEEIYAIPLDHIDEIVEVKPAQVFRVQGKPTIEIRKRIVALVSLGDLFRWGGKEHPARLRQNRLDVCESLGENGDDAYKLRVVIVQNGEITIGPLVDRADRHARSRAQVTGEELPVNPRPFWCQYSGRWPGLAHSRCRRRNHNGCQRHRSTTITQARSSIL